jgi:multiple sugar transport system permease protein
VLGWVGIDGPGWLDSTTLALPSLAVMSVWRGFGALMIIFLAGLQTIPKEMNEAAEMDGATGWGRFLHITLPMLRPVLLFGAVLTGIGYLQFFEEAFVMTKGGPLDATRSVTYYTYDQFGFGNFGYAAAASYLLFLAIVLLTYAQFRFLGEREEKKS